MPALLVFAYAACFVAALFNFFEISSYQQVDLALFGLAMIFFSLLVITLQFKNLTRGLLVFALVVGLALRVLALVSPPTTTDLARYHSDGSYLLEFKNPYKQKPADGVEFKSLTTIYPLLSQALFTIGALVSKNKNIFKYIFGFFELLLVAWYYWQFMRGRPPRPHRGQLLLFLLLNPLMIFEFHHEGHLESFVVLLFTLGFFYLLTRRYQTRVLAMGLAAFAAKFYGLLLLTAQLLPRKSGDEKKWFFYPAWAYLVTAIIVALVILPFSNLADNSSGMISYLQYWNHAQPVFAWLVSMQEFSEATAIRICQLITVLLGTFALWQLFRGKLSPARFVIYCITAYLLFFPVQHPWYYSLAIPVILFSRKNRLFWMLLTTLISFNYLVYTGTITAGQMLAVYLVSFLAWRLTVFATE